VSFATLELTQDKHNLATKMSSERETVLQRIENYETDLREINEELKKTNDPVEKADLKKRRDRLEETIGTLEKRALALTGKTSS
jgi:predicted nuclease with TOPRIM domain